MSICIISDHIIMLRQNFIIANTQHIDQVKSKYEGGGGGGGGGGGASAPKAPPPPLDPPLLTLFAHCPIVIMGASTYTTMH